jgi:hypothetical protein
MLATYRPTARETHAARPGAGAALRVDVLGPLRVRWEGGADAIDLGPPQRRALLLRLLVADACPVSVERLCDDLLEGAPPAAAASSVQAHTSSRRPRTGLVDISSPAAIGKRCVRWMPRRHCGAGNRSTTPKAAASPRASRIGCGKCARMPRSCGRVCCTRRATMRGPSPRPRTSWPGTRCASPRGWCCCTPCTPRGEPPKHSAASRRYAAHCPKRSARTPGRSCAGSTKASSGTTSSAQSRDPAPGRTSPKTFAGSSTPSPPRPVWAGTAHTSSTS